MQYNFPAGTIGFSLVRFSTKAQADGDSYRRQVAAAEAFGRDEAITLDISLHEVDIRKLGISGFTGAHIIRGPLCKFLAGIENGTVKPGSLLLVSEWNRLTRQVSSDAIKLVLAIMEKGIGIVDLQDRNYYTLARYNGDVGLQLGLQLKISMANQYSENLRHNLIAKWESRRVDARAGNGKASNACPTWLRADDGKFEPIPARVAVIEAVRDYRFLGMGKAAIAGKLNAAGIPAFRGPNGWHPSAIERLVKNEALLGTYQPHRADGSDDGEPIEGFYPRVMSDGDWWRMQWPATEKLPRGEKSVGVKNLLQEVVHCAACGAGLVYVDKGRGNIYLTCSKSRRGLCADHTHHNYPALESELLAALALFDVSSLMRKGNPEADRIAGLSAEIEAKSATLDRLVEDFSADVPKAVSRRIATLSAEIEGLEGQRNDTIRAAKITEARATGDAYGEFRAMVDGLVAMPAGEGRDQIRLRLAAELRRLFIGAEALGTEILFRLDGALDLIVEKSRMVEARIMDAETEDFFAFTRAQIFDDPSFDPVGMFEAFMNRNREAA